jgi:hypothetical protein
MKKFSVIAVLLAFVCFEADGQMDQVKRRARDLSNQNNVRQGVPPPVQIPPRAAQPVAPRTMIATNAATVQAKNVAKIQKDLAAIKAGSSATDAQKQQLAMDVTGCARGTKPGSAIVKTFVDSLAAVLPDGTVTPEQQSRLAQNIEAVANSKEFSSVQYDAILADVKATLEVAGISRKTTEVPVKNLKVIGDEVRR